MVVLKPTEVSGVVSMSCVVVLVLIGLATVWKLKDPRGSTDRQDEEMRLIYNAVLASSVVAWPIVFDATIGLAALTAEPKLLFGFLWPVLLGLIELNYVSSFSTVTGKAGRASALFQHADLSKDTSAIISAAFAMGSLLLGSRKNSAVNYIIMYALLFCVAFLVPTLQIPPDTKPAIMWRSVQKVVLNYAIGFTIAGISTDLLPDVFREHEAGPTRHEGGPPHPQPTPTWRLGGTTGATTAPRFAFRPITPPPAAATTPNHASAAHSRSRLSVSPPSSPLPASSESPGSLLGGDDSVLTNLRFVD
jgi:hypothetical protein